MMASMSYRHVGLFDEVVLFLRGFVAENKVYRAGRVGFDGDETIAMY